MNIFFILFLFRYFVCEDLEYKKTVIELNDSIHLSSFNLEDIIEPIYSFILCYILVEFHDNDNELILYM